MEGWIKLHKSIMNNWVWSDPVALKAWLDLLISVNYIDKKILFDGDLMTIERGQIMTSIRKLAEKWACTPRKANKLLQCFVNDEMVTLKKTKRGTLLTVLNYGLYQDMRDTADYTASTTADYTAGHTASIQHKNIKNNKEIKEKKKGPRYFSNDDLEDAFREFMKMRNKIKKPMTDRAIDLMIRKLDRMSSDPKQQIKILEQSITHCWQDIYELKEEEKPKEEKYDRELFKKLVVKVEDYGTDQD